jgi:hypothetical protein
MWYTPIAVWSVVIVGLIVSYLTGPLKPNEVDPKLLIFVSDVFCCCLPKRIRDWLRCGYTNEAYSDNQVKNDIELAPSDGYDALHTSPSTQTFGIDTVDKLPPDGTIRKTVDGAYDNPTMIMKDERYKE